MIVRDFIPKRKNDIIRIKFCPGTSKKVNGKIIINSMHYKSKHNVKITVGLGEFKEMIRLFEKEAKEVKEAKLKL